MQLRGGRIPIKNFNAFLHEQFIPSYFKHQNFFQMVPLECRGLFEFSQEPFRDAFLLKHSPVIRFATLLKQFFLICKTV